MKHAEFVGCSPSLSGALRVNPWSIDSIAEGIYTAIKMNKADQVMRHNKHWAYVEGHTVKHWAGNFTQYLVAATEGHNERKTYALGLGLDNFRIVALDPSFRKLQADMLVEAYRRSKRSLILCDYDGTLVPTNQVCCLQCCCFPYVPSDCAMRIIGLFGTSCYKLQPGDVVQAIAAAV